MMQPASESRLGLLWRWCDSQLRQYPRIARLVALSACLILFLFILPAYMRAAFWTGLLSNKILMGMLVGFCLLAISLVWSAGQSLDAWAFLFFNLRGSRPAWLDRGMLSFSQVGSGIFTLGIALVLSLVWDRILAYDLVLGTLSLWLVVELLKFLLHRSRPFSHLEQTRIVGGRARGQSFPSGHTAQSFFLATLIVQYYHLSFGLALVLYSAALLVGITRMYIGAHYPRDVLAGAILGSAWGLAGVLLVDGFLMSGFFK